MLLILVAVEIDSKELNKLKMCLLFCIYTFSYLYFVCNQHFPVFYFFSLRNFDLLRVDLVVSLFSRILDLHNFELVMHCLTPYEAGCLYCRLGWYVLFFLY